MRIKHEKFIFSNNWQYYIDTFFAILPTLLNTGSAMPQFIWFGRYWQTYPIDTEGRIVETYRATFMSDPRKK